MKLLFEVIIIAPFLSNFLISGEVDITLTDTKFYFSRSRVFGHRFSSRKGLQGWVWTMFWSGFACSLNQATTRIGVTMNMSLNNTNSKQRNFICSSMNGLQNLLVIIPCICLEVRNYYARECRVE
jgi:hypothetical protein